MNIIRLYEGSHQFNVIETELNISPDFAQMKLAQQYEYRPTSETLWAEIVVNGVSERYILDYEHKLLKKVNLEQYTVVNGAVVYSTY